MLRAESNNIAETVATVNSPREQLLDKRGVARLSQSTPRSVENWMARGLIPYLKIGRLVRFRESDVLAALDKRCRVN